MFGTVLLALVLSQAPMEDWKKDLLGPPRAVQKEPWANDPIVVPAPRSGGSAMVLGVGNQSCAAWTKAHLTNNPYDYSALSMDSWLGGFLTGLNVTSSDGDISAGIDQLGMRAWITNYCTANPLDDVYLAAQKLAAELRVRKRR